MRVVCGRSHSDCIRESESVAVRSSRFISLSDSWEATCQRAFRGRVKGNVPVWNKIGEIQIFHFLAAFFKMWIFESHS